MLPLQDLTTEWLACLLSLSELHHTIVWALLAVSLLFTMYRQQHVPMPSLESPLMPSKRCCTSLVSCMRLLYTVLPGTTPPPGKFHAAFQVCWNN